MLICFIDMIVLWNSSLFYSYLLVAKYGATSLTTDVRCVHANDFTKAFPIDRWTNRRTDGRTKLLIEVRESKIATLQGRLGG